MDGVQLHEGKGTRMSFDVDGVEIKAMLAFGPRPSIEWLLHELTGVATLEETSSIQPACPPNS
jgi:hypothetical protein